VKFFLLVLCVASVAVPLISARQHLPAVPLYTCSVLHTFPHDPHAFTQGLEYRGGYLYEGTGLNGQSTLRKEDLGTGRVLQQISIADRFFGEGITVFPDRILELTWKAHTGFIYGRQHFQLLDTFSYDGEGWGLANDGEHIYMSDGSSQIRIWDPKSLREERRITVHLGGKQFESLNELEWVRGEIFANVWQTDEILRISPRDGTVLGIVELPGLLSVAERESGADVLNGIAYDAQGDRLFVTGKFWPKLFQIELVKSK
jgi:glutamine cyclotransferase